MSQDTLWGPLSCCAHRACKSAALLVIMWFRTYAAMDPCLCYALRAETETETESESESESELNIGSAFTLPAEPAASSNSLGWGGQKASKIVK